MKTADAHWRELAYSALSTLRRRLSGQRGSQVLGRVNLGAGVGLGSIIYGFAAAGDWLNDPQLLDEAASRRGGVDCGAPSRHSEIWGFAT